MRGNELFHAIRLAVCLVAFSCTAGWAGDRFVASRRIGDCTLGVEVQDHGRVLRLRASADPGKACNVDPDAMVSLLTEAFAQTDPPRLEGPFSSLFLGRMIDYPWMSQHLALSAAGDAQWDRRSGKPRAGDPNRYVGKILFSEEVISRIEPPLRQNGYRIVAASVEKVLIGPFEHVPFFQGKAKPGKVPFDAMVWFRLRKEQ